MVLIKGNLSKPMKDEPNKPMDSEVKDREGKIRQAMKLIDAMNPDEMARFMRDLMQSVMVAEEEARRVEEQARLAGMPRSDRIVSVVEAAFPYPPQSYWATNPMIPPPDEWWSDEGNIIERKCYLGFNIIVKSLACSMLEKLPPNKWLNDALAELMGLMRDIEACLRSGEVADLKGLE